MLGLNTRLVGVRWGRGRVHLPGGIACLVQGEAGSLGGWGAGFPQDLDPGGESVHSCAFARRRGHTYLAENTPSGGALPRSWGDLRAATGTLNISRLKVRTYLSVLVLVKVCCLNQLLQNLVV